MSKRKIYFGRRTVIPMGKGTFETVATEYAEEIEIDENADFSRERRHLMRRVDKLVQGETDKLRKIARKIDKRNGKA